MKKPRGTTRKGPLTTSDMADQLLKQLIRAGAIDQAYVAKLENRPPRAVHRHPDEKTSVAVHELYRNDEPAGSPASRLAKLHKVLASNGIELRTTNTAPLAPARAGTVRVFRAETDRVKRNGGEFAGWVADPPAKGGYFTSGLAGAHQYGEPRVAPQGAPLRYVDLPQAVVDASAVERAEIIDELRSRSQRPPARRVSGVLRNREYYLDREWSGRAVAVPAVVEEPLVETGDAALDARGWMFGREQLKVVSSPIDVQVTLQYVSGTGLKPARGNVHPDWRPATSGARSYANAELVIQLGDQRVLFVRIGERAGSLSLLNSFACSSDNRDRADYNAFAAAFQGVPFVVTGAAASVLRGERSITGTVDHIEITVPHSALATFAHVVARGAMMVEGASRRLCDKDKASLVRRLRSSAECVTMRSAELGRIGIRPVTDGEFARLSRDSHRASISVTNSYGECEIFTVRVARRNPTPEHDGAPFTTSFELDLQRYLQHPTDGA